MNSKTEKTLFQEQADSEHMKKNFYYYSKEELRFVPVRNFYRKLLIAFLLTAIISGGTFTFIYITFDKMLNPQQNLSELQARNTQLVAQLKILGNQYKDLEKKVDKLFNKNNELRLAVNLTPEEKPEEEFGIGGSLFENVDPRNTEEEKRILLQLSDFANKLDVKVKNELNSYSEVKSKLIENEKFYECLPAIKPVQAAYGDRFGMRYHPILKIRRMHSGVDFLANTGTPVYAPGAGKVIYAGRNGGYGLTLKIDHGYGYVTLYAHLKKIKVKRRQYVKRGDLIAISGNSGSLSTGPHLHYEVRYKGIALNPKNFIFEDVDIFDYRKKIKNIEKQEQQAYAFAID